eukprot:146391-Pyramimonas_sp.AAC.1
MPRPRARDWFPVLVDVPSPHAIGSLSRWMHRPRTRLAPFLGGCPLLVCDWLPFRVDALCPRATGARAFPES